MNFDESVAAHLDTVRQRDLPGFSATIADDVTVILPNGTLLSGREEVEEFHKGWFEDPDWKMTTTVASTRSDDETGTVIYDVTYDDLDGDGEPYSMSYVLSLSFRRKDGKWLLVHDQNTLR
ncbi:MAG TPA: SgcJ/EcaC family oxidoreductase [Candidatus Stackebrandtia excrementipullorum]|nr:SgcJ/EcaC family oxidoreductase [Candidatus Stackebrandtia excrementipullorum]